MADRGLGAIAHGYAERETCARVPSSSCLTLILTLPWSALDTGQRSSARPTIRSNFTASSPGTTARTDRSTLVIRGAPSTSSRVHSAVTANRSGGEPSSPRTSASAIAKQLAWAPAISSSGLVLPSGCLVREAHVTASSSSALLPLISVPAPRARDPSHWTSASRRAMGMVGLPLRMCAVSRDLHSSNRRKLGERDQHRRDVHAGTHCCSPTGHPRWASWLSSPPSALKALAGSQTWSRSAG